jgi:hypothetical protein
MSPWDNRKSGKRSAAPLLISIFWLVSTIITALGTVYLTGPETNITAKDAGAPAGNETRVAHETGDQSTPVQRPMRVTSLEALHLKIKSGLRIAGDPLDALAPAEPVSILLARVHTKAVATGSSLTFGYSSFFSARAPPVAVA